MKTLVMLTVAAAASVAMGTAQAKTLAGTYDGHCDGFSLTLSSNGAAYGVETGCESGAIAGAKVKGGAVINEPHVAGAVFKINSTNDTWIIYTTSGAILQQGTYTPVAAAAHPIPDVTLRPTGR